MKIAARAAALFLILVYLAAVGAGLWAPAPYDEQFREYPNAHPSQKFWMGTDDLGRDRFSRLLYGARISLLLAPAAAMLSVLIALSVALPAGFLGGKWDRLATAVMDLFFCLPWLFVLLAVRALLPLDVDAWMSIAITFLLLGTLSWAQGARVLRAGARSLAVSDCIMQARASGCGTLRIALVHLLPQLRPLIVSQFWLSIPVFLLTEANLGMLGLGVTEPMPSLGNLLTELSNYHLVLSSPWVLAPAILLLLVLTSLHLTLSKEAWS